MRAAKHDQSGYHHRAIASGLGIAFSGSQDVLCAECTDPFRIRSPFVADPVGERRSRHQTPVRVETVHPASPRRLRYAFLTHRTLLILIVPASIYTFGSGAFTTLFPVFGRQLLGLGPVEVGYLWSWLEWGCSSSSIGLIWLERLGSSQTAVGNCGVLHWQVWR